MCLFIYVLYTCIYTYKYVSICVCVYLFIYLSVYVRMGVRLKDTHAHTHTHHISCENPAVREPVTSRPCRSTDSSEAPREAERDPFC